MKNLFLLLAVVLSANVLQAQKAVYQTGKGAIDGYDPVAYFTDSRPVPGAAGISYRWKDADWHFATAEHRDLFKANPEKYAPQYGGYCAYGWAQGNAVKIEPDAWSVLNGKLYLNYDLSIQKKWSKNTAEYIRQADKNWKAAQQNK